jgi:hypothetical protein
MEMYNMPSDQFGNDLEEDLGWDLDIFDEESSSPSRSGTDLNEEEDDSDEDYKELSRIRNEDIRYINGGKYD